MTRLFIYGTLKRGCSNHFYMHGQSFIAPAATEPKFRLFNLGGYPGMVPAEDGLSIQGEIWEVDDKCKQALDELEDIEGGEYQIQRINLIEPHNDEPMLSYIYNRSVAGYPDVGDSWPLLITR